MRAQTGSLCSTFRSNHLLAKYHHYRQTAQPRHLCTTMASEGTRVKVGLLGTGWAVKVQVPQFRAAGVEISAIYSRSQARADELAKEHSIPHAFSDVGELIKSDQVDLVSIVTPPYLHAQQFLDAVAAGKHVLVDKPLCLNTTEAEQMARAALAKPKQVILVDHELRFTEMAKTARSILHSGQLGTVSVIRVNVLVPPFKKTFDWWSEADKGGGMLGALGSHGIDMVRYLTNGEVTQVSANITQLRRQLPDEQGNMHQATADDWCSGTMIVRPKATTNSNSTPNPSDPSNPSEPYWGDGQTYAREIQVQFLFGAYGVHPQPNIPPVIVHGDQGCITIDHNTSSMRHYGADGKVVQEVTGQGSAFAATGTRALGEALNRALGGPRDLSAIACGASIVDGLATVYVMDAIRESAEKGGAPITCKLVQDCQH